MSSVEANKAVVVRWFTEFWGETCNLGVVDDIAAPGRNPSFRADDNGGDGDMNLIGTESHSRLPVPSAREDVMPSRIAYAIGETALGKMLVARSAAGVCAILFGADAEGLEGDLAARFPKSMLTVDAPRLREDLARVARFLEAPRRGLDLELDMRGTAFQRRVWEALRAIPAGTTATYVAVARGLGEPNAARAVAAACAANPLALAVPCHRVVRSGGALAGYRWGIERKRELLRKEALA